MRVVVVMLLVGNCLGNPRLDAVPFPDFPDSLGVAGAFMGVSNGVLIVAGGSVFDRPLWAGGTKQLRNEIWVLRRGIDGQYIWAHGGKLPVEVSNGTSVTVAQGVVCIGGVTASGETNHVFMLRWNEEKETVELADLPSLPRACAYGSATSYKSRIIAAGGKDAMSPDGMDHCWELDLMQAHQNGWKLLNRLPTPRFGAILATLEAHGKPYLLLASGKRGPHYLTDSYHCALDDAGSGWERLDEMPRAALVAATTVVGDTSMLVFGGSDGVNIENRLTLRNQYHLNDTVLHYDTSTKAWTDVGRMPEGVVATQAIPWKDGVLLVGGELGNAMRSRKVWWFKEADSQGY